MNVLMWGFATPIQFYVGRKFYINAFKALKYGHPDMNVLVCLGTTSAYTYSFVSVIYGAVYPQFPVKTFFEMSTMLVPIIMLGKYLENIAKGNTSQAIQKLMNLRANEAILLEGYSTENHHRSVKKEIVISTDLVQRGDFLKVLPGKSIPSDGVLIYGTSCVDESMLTGESMPIPKNVGNLVIGGTIS